LFSGGGSDRTNTLAAFRQFLEYLDREWLFLDSYLPCSPADKNDGRCFHLLCRRSLKDAMLESPLAMTTPRHMRPQ
jgi:hypothetical protein